MKRITENHSYSFSDMKTADVSEAAKDDAMGQWLWKVSEKWTGLSEGVQ